MTRAKTQRRQENQGHNLGALSRVKTFSKPIGFICFKVLTGEAGKVFGFLGAFASLREIGFGFACFNIQGTLVTSHLLVLSTKPLSGANQCPVL